MAPSREHAKRLILAGKVVAEGIKTPLKPGLEVPGDTILELTESDRFVSRGGVKLQAALDRFEVVVDGKCCADIGASTGGFTDCFLQNGAKQVFAVDVGLGQLADKLRKDSRVIFLGHVNARNLTGASFSDRVECAAVDVSFISLTKILEPLFHAVGDGCDGLFLIKPQFEAGKEQVSKGRGIIRDPLVHREILESILCAMANTGWEAKGVIASPISGGSGNREFLCHAIRRDSAGAPIMNNNIPIDQLFQEPDKPVTPNSVDGRPE